MITASSGWYSTLASRAALRAVSWLVAATANSGLADVFHVFAGQERIPREHRANVQMARYVRRCHHRDHPRIGGHGGQVHG